jgi:ceramide glucosyltransferase
VALDLFQLALLLALALNFFRVGFSHLVSAVYRSLYDRRFARKNFAPTVSMVKPVRGIDEISAANLEIFCQQEYPSAHELLFCVEDANDPAVAVIEGLIARYPQKDIRLIFSGPQNLRAIAKMRNVIAGYQASRYEALVFSDQDVRVTPSFIAESVQCLKDTRIGLGFALPMYEGARDAAAALLGSFANSMFTSAFVLTLLQPTHWAVGSVMVFRREVLEKIGGLEQFGYGITDDLILARAVQEHHLRIHILKEPARILHPHDTFGRAYRNILRWLVITRALSWLVYWGFMLELNFLFCLLYILTLWLTRQNVLPGLEILAAYAVIRTASFALLEWRFARPRTWRFIWLVPFFEFLKTVFYAHSMFVNEVEWRGRRLRVHPDGTANFAATQP